MRSRAIHSCANSAHEWGTRRERSSAVFALTGPVLLNLHRERRGEFCPPLASGIVPVADKCESGYSQCGAKSPPAFSTRDSPVLHVFRRISAVPYVM